MKRLTQWLVACAVVGTVTHAFAAEHLMRINEILRSKNADTGIQYVELLDLSAVGESFPSGPYKLELFDANGVSQGSTSMTLTPTPVHKRFVATAAADAAFGTTRTDTLNTVLPENGQLCFEDNANIKIDCVAWGCITTFVKVGETRAPTPPDGMSVQRQTDGTFQVATPTPDASNIAGTSMAACPTDPMDMPPDAAVPHDVFDVIDGSTNPNNPGSGGGCCEVDGKTGAAGTGILLAAVLVGLRRRRR